MVQTPTLWAQEREENPHQPLLKGFEVTPDSKPSPKPTTETIIYLRKKQRTNDGVTDSGLRFDASVPVKTSRYTIPK